MTPVSDSRKQYLDAFSRCLEGSVRSSATALACVAERWSLIVHSTTHLNGRPWLGGAVLEDARHKLWLLLRGHSAGWSLDAEAVFEACPHADDDGGLFWHFATAGAWQCIVDALQLLGKGHSDGSTCGALAVDAGFTAIRLAACWVEFQEVREYNEDEATHQAILRSRFFLEEMRFFEELAGFLTGEHGDSSAAAAQMFVNSRRWSCDDFLLPGFWRCDSSV